MSACWCGLRAPPGATSTRSTRISSRLMSAALLIPVPDVAAIGLSPSAPPLPGVCATTADPTQSTATTIADASCTLTTGHLTFRLRTLDSPTPRLPDSQTPGLPDSPPLLLPDSPTPRLHHSPTLTSPFRPR